MNERAYDVSKLSLVLRNFCKNKVNLFLKPKKEGKKSANGFRKILSEKCKFTSFLYLYQKTQHFSSQVNASWFKNISIFLLENHFWQDTWVTGNTRCETKSTALGNNKPIWRLCSKEIHKDRWSQIRWKSATKSVFSHPAEGMSGVRPPSMNTQFPSKECSRDFGSNRLARCQWKVRGFAFWQLRSIGLEMNH